MRGTIEEMFDDVAAQQEVLEDSWWTYQGSTGHDNPQAIIHVIKATEDEFKKVVYVTSGNYRLVFPKSYPEYRDEHDLREMANLERGLEELPLHTFKLWIYHGTFQQISSRKEQ